MKLKFFLVLYILTYGFTASAQSKGSDVVIGTNYIIQSQILNQERGIQVYLPDSYETESDKRYPVLYVLDGQWYFANGVAVQKSLRTPGFIPEMIVVGILNKNPLRRTLFSSESEKFTLFLEKEVLSFIDATFRTNDDRILFGWENSANYTSQMILSAKNLFNGAIATNGGYANLEQIKKFNARKNPSDRYLYIANSKKDIYSIDFSEELSRLLTKEEPNHLIWKYELFNDEIHESLAHIALYKGLTYYYHNYPKPDFESIQDYLNRGGLSYLKEYYKERGERFGINTEINNSTKNTLIWLAWRRDNFEYFTFFMDEFKDVLVTNRYQSAYWQNRLGQFYLKYKDYDHAIQYFEFGIQNYPDPKRMTTMYNGLGDAYSGKGMKKDALSAYNKSLEIDADQTQIKEKVKQITKR